MKEIELTEINYLEIKDNSIKHWVDYGKGEYAVIKAVIESFLRHCKKNNYTVIDGKVLQKNEEEK